MDKKQKIGKFGEDVACRYLEKNEYKILDRNFTCTQGEIDIIAFDEKNKEVVFIEVKTRTNFNYGFPVDAVNNIKLNHILNSAKYYVYKKGINKSYLRIDVIEIVINKGKYKLNHLKGVIQ